MDNKKNVSRRDFLKTTGIATGALLGGGLIGGLVGYSAKKEPPPPPTAAPPELPDPITLIREDVNTRGRMFFSNPHEFAELGAAVERIFPEDETGPGAIGLGVPYFIDNQLAGNYGSNAKEYMQGPFSLGDPTQGYQSHLTRGEIFRQGIGKLEAEAKREFGKRFTELEGEQMDVILSAFQNNEVEMTGVTSAFFFRLLRSATLEGAYSDPIYNGNFNMEAWRMKGFPGHQMSFINEIESEEYIVMEPQSISSMEH